MPTCHETRQAFDSSTGTTWPHFHRLHEQLFELSCEHDDPPSPPQSRHPPQDLTGPAKAPPPRRRNPQAQPLPPQLAAFSRAYRTAFQVPDSTPSIAGLITEHHHRLWIEDFLGRLQSAQLQSHHQQARNA